VIFEFAVAEMLFAGLVSVFNLVLALMGRAPSLWSLGGNVLLGLVMVAQMFVTVVLIVNGDKPAGDIFEVFGYEFATFLVLLGAMFWSLVDRSKTSTLVLAIAPFAVLVMVARLLQIWG
jgi:hypothetical protein